MVDGRGDGSLVDRTPVERPNGIVNDTPVKIGEPYQVGGTTYTPVDKLDYDDVGYASWYGEELGGKATANGEAFDPNAVTAAHRTLPLPSYVEVTSLDTGKTILVRVNDRGPFSNDRLIDLSAGAARQLGVEGQGHAPVRVRRVNPPENERALLRSGAAATERLESPPMMLTALRRKLGIATVPPATGARAGNAPAPVAVPVPASAPEPRKMPITDDGRFIIEYGDRQGAPAPRPAVAPSAQPAASLSGNWFVQVAAFGSKPRADAMAKRAGARVDSAGSIWRVRLGPYRSEAEAKEALRSIHAKGYPGARVLSGG